MKNIFVDGFDEGRTLNRKESIVHVEIRAEAVFELSEEMRVCLDPILVNNIQEMNRRSF